MRGETDRQPSMFSYVDLESRIPKDHPIRKIRRIVDEALPNLEPAFERMYSDQGRPSIPPNATQPGSDYFSEFAKIIAFAKNTMTQNSTFSTGC